MWKFIDRFWLFLQNLFNALKFAAYDYDVVLRRTKTPKQRLTIWAFIVLIILFILFIFLFMLSRFFQIIFREKVIDLYNN